MVDRSSVPGVRVTVDRGNQGLVDFKRGLAGIEEELRRVRRAARDASAAVDALRVPRGAGGGPQRAGISQGDRAAARTQAEDDRPDRQIARQRQRADAADARIARARRNAERDKIRVDQRAADRELDDRFAKRLGQSERSGFLYRAVNAAGWAPGIPPEVYLTQMALGEMGLGLPLAAVAGGVGAVGLGLAGLGLNAAMTDQARTGERMAAQLGTTPAFTTGGDVSKQLDLLSRRYGFTGDQAQQIAGGLAAGGLTRAQATSTDEVNGAFAQAASLVNTFGLTIQQATDLVSEQYTELGRSGRDVTAMLQGLAQVAISTGIPAGNLAAILAGAPDLAANVGSAQMGQAASVFAKVYGNTQDATTMAELASAHGTGAFALAGFLGTDVTQLDQFRSTKAGTGQVADMLDAKARQLAATNGQEGGFAAFNAFLQGAGGQTISWDAFQAALRAAPNAGALAASVAVTAGSPVPGSAQTGLALTAVGQPGAGAAAANPMNVKDMAVNAAKVQIDVLGSQVAGLGAVLSGQAGPTQLSQIAAQGGPAGNAALAGLALGGNPGALGQLVRNAVPAALQAALTPAVGPQAAAQIAQQVDHVLHLTLDVRQNGQTIGTKQVTTPLPNGGQTYGQYTPPGSSGTRAGGQR